MYFFKTRVGSPLSFLNKGPYFHTISSVSIEHQIDIAWQKHPIPLVRSINIGKVPISQWDKSASAESHY
jgi:hypothetical protein